MSSSSKTNDAWGLNRRRPGDLREKLSGNQLRIDMASHLRLAGTLHEQQQVQTIMVTAPR
jgi:hypothetical protein